MIQTLETNIPPLEPKPPKQVKRKLVRRSSSIQEEPIKQEPVKPEEIHKSGIFLSERQRKKF